MNTALATTGDRLLFMCQFFDVIREEPCPTHVLLSNGWSVNAGGVKETPEARTIAAPFLGLMSQFSEFEHDIAAICRDACRENDNARFSKLNAALQNYRAVVLETKNAIKSLQQ